jgi:C4-dicarboxylate-specific signal transduction histidine kinase
MQNVNQIFYLMFAVFALGIALNAYIDFRKQNIRSVIKVYWIIAMTLIVISSLSYAIGSFGLPLFLFFGSAFLISSLLTVGYLIRSISRTLTRQWIAVSACLILALIAFLGYLLAIQAPYLYRLLTVAFILLALTVWQIWEIQQTKKVDNSIHLRFIQYLLFGLIVLIVFRILTATDPQYDGVNYLFEETSAALFVRLTLSASYLLLFFFISNYFYDKLLVGERNALAQLGEKKAELKNTVKENEEIKHLLQERESLIKSLMRSNKTAATGALSASIAHELNQPLGASKLNIQFLKHKLEQGELDANTQKELFAALELDNNRASTIVRSLRSIFTDEKAAVECANLTSLIESILVIVRPELRAKQIQLELKLPAALHAPVRQTEIQQVILNLVNNAIQSLEPSDQKEKRITIEGTSDVHCMQIAITDNGAGVSPDIQADLFTILSSAKKTGMGLGLWLCQHIITRHGGRIWYEDAPQGGARFCIELPQTSF